MSSRPSRACAKSSRSSSSPRPTPSAHPSAAAPAPAAASAPAIDSETDMGKLDTLPPWARELSEKYYGQTLAMFVLHGNVRDLAGLRTPDTPFASIGQFLRSSLFPSRDIVMTYDRGSGLAFADPEMQKDFRRAIEGYDQFHGTNFAAAGLPRNPDGVLGLLDNYLRLRLAD